MHMPGENPSARAHHNGGELLPLFRPQALEHQQQKSYGQIILIRPLSLMLLTWLALAMVGVTLAFLLLGHYTERIRITGALVAGPGGARSSAADFRAELYVPARWLSSVSPGRHLTLRCRGCAGSLAAPTGTVLAISNAPLDSPQESFGGAQSFEPKYKVTVLLPPTAQITELGSPPQAGTPVEAEIPLGSKPLIKWFFERSGS